MKNYFRFDDVCHTIYQMLLGRIDTEFASKSLAEVQANPNYDPSMDWMIDLSLYESKQQNRLPALVSQALLGHAGKCAVILDRPYSLRITGISETQANPRFFITKGEALEYLGKTRPNPLAFS